MNDTPPVGQRAEQLLKNLVELYLRDGQPVGSKVLATQMVPSVSSATVRKVLQDLESLGYLHSRHTSAGRVPTSRGLRFFVDRLSTFHPLDLHIKKEVESQINPLQATDSVVSQVSAVLSELTHMVGIVSMPKCERLILKHVEFLPLTENRVLAILVVNNKDVQNRIIVTDKPYEAFELTQASNFLNQHFVGKDLTKSRMQLLSELRSDRTKIDSLMQAVIDVAGKAFVHEKNEQHYVVTGQEKLLSAKDDVPFDQLQKIFEAFTKKQQILHLLDECIGAEGIQLFIGDEWGDGAFESCSVITSRYQYNGDNVGVLGVIGPSRMHYQQVIPVVELTAKLLTSALNSEI
jgi:heat-inducible transcriptional repressor